MVTGSLPFQGTNSVKIHQNIMKNGDVKLNNSKHPDWVCKIVEGLLKIDSNQRICHDQILKLLPISLNNIRVTKATDFNPEDLLTILLRVMPDAGIEINHNHP